MEKLNPKNYHIIFNLKEDVLLTYYFEIGMRRKLKRFGLANIELIYIDGQFYFNKRDIAKYNFSNKKIMAVIKKLRRFLKEYLKFCEEIRGKNYAGKNWLSLISDFKKFVSFLGKAMAIVDVPVYCESFFEKRVMAGLKENGFRQKDFYILSTPLYESYRKRRHADLIKIKAEKMTKAEFRQKWGWSNTMAFSYRPVDETFLDKALKEIKDFRKEKEIFNRRDREEKSRFNKLYRRLPTDLRKDADLIQELIAIRDYRVEVINRGCYCAMNLLGEISRRLELNYKEVINLTPEEIIKKKIPVDLSARLKGFACVADKIYTGEELRALWDLFNRKEEADFVKGTPASKGIVKGRARIILKAAESGKLKKGEILICEQTTPDYLVGIKKAAAIVTNIGGLTCHAAIISREFGIPCIVGTKIATQVLKDGDRVEVDANKGIVRILK
ncbi:MAG: PEP-utilizing enzyme [Patescibacteria group bacterium]